MIELGAHAKDIVTGFEGVVTGRAQYLTGCDQYILSPKASGADFKSGHWFDENRLSVLKKSVVVLPKLADKKTGGPVSNPAPTK